MEKLMLIDGNSILNRVLRLQGPRMLTAADGLHTNAIYAFLNILNKYLQRKNRSIYAWLSTSGHRRSGTVSSTAISAQEGDASRTGRAGPLYQEILDAMNIKRLEVEGYEADDIIGSVSKCAEERKMQVVIVTGDRDSLQLASENTRIYTCYKGRRTETEHFDAAAVFGRYGVTPAQLIDVKR